MRRVHSHAVAALINFCEGVERNNLNVTSKSKPSRHLLWRARPILARWVCIPSRCRSLLKNTLDPQHYSNIMPLLLNVLRNANGPDYGKLRVRTMECAGLIGASLRDSQFYDLPFERGGARAGRHCN
jgi:importin-5